MNVLNLKRVPNYEVKEWLYSIPELTKYQKERIEDDEIIRFAPFHFYKQNDNESSLIWRLTLAPLLLVYIIIVISLPVNFIITGKWGYNKLGWFSKWYQKLKI